MKKFRFCALSIAIIFMLTFFHAKPTFSQISFNLQQPDITIDSETRLNVIDTAIKTLDEYVFPEVAQKVQAEIRTRLQNKAYDNITSAKKLASTLTNQIQAISRDKHLRVFYSYKPFPQINDRGQTATPEEQEKERRSAAWRNFGFQKVERLAGNIGYLDLRAFIPPEVARETAIAAMNFLSNTDALIIDLRQNGGGSPHTIALISTYLFDEKPVHLNDLHWRERDASGTFSERIEEYWTLPSVPGQRYLNKEVYVLTSNFTFSAAEEFANNLKQLKRATIIGETTGGGANPGRFKRLSDRFGMFIPTGRAVNPITKTNWEGVGVQPDVKISAKKALSTAHLAALKGVLAKTTEPELVDELKQTIGNSENKWHKFPKFN